MTERNVCEEDDLRFNVASSRLVVCAAAKYKYTSFIGNVSLALIASFA